MLFGPSTVFGLSHQAQLVTRLLLLLLLLLQLKFKLADGLRFPKAN